MAETQEVEEETQEAPEEVTEIVEEEGPSIEDRARLMGWHDRDEFDGAPERWTPADEFVRRGEEILPVLRENQRTMGAKILELESRAKAREDYFNMEVAAMKNRHQAELEKERAKAVEDGDIDKFNATQKQIDDLNTAPPSVQNVTAAPPEIKQFMVDNPWYKTDGEMTRYAVSESNYDVETNPELTLKQNLERTLNKVKARFPEKFGEQPMRTSRRAPQVEAGRRTVAKKNSKTYGNMPTESQTACDRAVHIGMCRDRETFVKNYYDSIGAE